MSITFCVQGAPSVLVNETCFRCEQDLEFGVSRPEPCYVCRGTGIMQVPESLWPEINLSNGNAHALMEALAVQPEPCGAWEGEELHTILARIKALQGNDATRREWFPERPRSESGGDGRARVVDCGRSTEQIDRYLARLREVVEKAITEGREVTWA